MQRNPFLGLNPAAQTVSETALSYHKMTDGSSALNLSRTPVSKQVSVEQTRLRKRRPAQITRYAAAYR